jgi:hypothetical protein
MSTPKNHAEVIRNLGSEVANAFCNAGSEVAKFFERFDPGERPSDNSESFDFENAISCNQNDVWTFFGFKGSARGQSLEKFKASGHVIDFMKRARTYWVIMLPCDVERFREHLKKRKAHDGRGKHRRTRKNAEERGRNDELKPSTS